MRKILIIIWTFMSFHLSCFMSILLLLISVYIKAEEPVIIRGRIINQNKQPIPYSSVYITTPQDPISIIKGAISNENGEFSLPSGKNKSYIFKVMFLGYKEYTTKIQTNTVELNLGNIILEEVAYKMSEVIVKPPLQVTADKIIYNFENDLNRSKSNLHDMLSKMPMISVGAMGKISVGSEDKTYIVLRKGREDALVNFQNVSFEEMLKRLPAMGFTTFEIWTVVPPKYEKYDYVINIIPDPNQKLFGAVGSPEVYYNFDKGELLSGMGGNGSANIFRITGGVKYGNINAPKYIRETNTTFYAKNNKPKTLFDQMETSYNNNTTWRANLSASLDISKRQFIAFSFNASFSDAKNCRQITAKKIIDSNTSSQSISNYTTKYETNSWNLGATYQLDFKKSDRSLNISYLIDFAPSERDNDREMNYTLGTDANEKTSTENNVKNQTHRIQFDYYDLFFKNKLKFNAQAGYLMMDYHSDGTTLNELTNINDISQYTRFEQDFHRIDGFINFSYNVNKRLNISTKANADYLPNYNTTKSITGTFEEYIKQKKLLFNMEGKLFCQFTIQEPKKETAKSFDEMTPDEKIAYMTKQIGAGISAKDIINNSSVVVPNSSLHFNYMYNQRRPGVRQLTNYSDEQDPLYIKRGNPNLYPETYHTFAIKFSSWFINTFSTFFSFSNDKIVLQTRREGDKIVESFYNSGKTRDFNIGLSHSFFKNKITISPNFNNSYINFGDGNWRKQQLLNIGARYNINISTFCNTGFSLNYYKRFNSGTEGEKDLFPLDLSMDLIWAPKICGKEVLISAGLNNVLQWDKRTKKYADMPDYHQLIKTEHHGIPLYISIRTTFGKFKVKPVKTTKSRARVNGFSTDIETSPK
ncbi:MAG: TonB-dependent receptor [Odoribacter sp.]